MAWADDISFGKIKRDLGPAERKFIIMHINLKRRSFNPVTGVCVRLWR